MAIQPTPPGPWSLPLIGNIWTLLHKEQCELFGQYKRQYGDIMYLHGLGNECVVLNTMESINDLLCQRGNEYSQRLFMPVVGELMGLNQSTVLRQNDAEWRLHRRFSHLVLNPLAVQQYHHMQEDSARRLCVSMFTHPEGFKDAIRLFSARIILGVTYGFSVESVDDKVLPVFVFFPPLLIAHGSGKYVKHSEATINFIPRAFIPGAYLCDLLPFMKHFPSWMPFRKEALIAKELIEQFVTMPYEHVKQQMSDGSAPPSLMRTLLQMEPNGIPDFEHAIKWTTGSMFGAAGDSTHATLLIFVLAMALNPDAQARARKEIDEVIGTQNFPTIADKARLPYVNAVIKETMRWRPVAPFASIRRSASNDTYQGYFIPRGAAVLPNIWAIAFEDNEKYDPQRFIPERFLDPTQDVVDPATWVFGFGKRICPGKVLAENSLFIAVVSILWACKISPPDGSIPNPRFTHKLVRCPEPFACKIEPTSAERSSLLQQQLA
ncbi:hypothetical protein ONZ45_g3424 [Pleurotus djamor]|nr:hypothetical protein ONZ45_g3424 [Pleurotus djamor]